MYAFTAGVSRGYRISLHCFADVSLLKPCLGHRAPHSVLTLQEEPYNCAPNSILTPAIHRTGAMVKKSKREKKIRRRNNEETRYFREGSSWTEEWVTAITAPRVNRPIALSRLTALLSGPDPVNGAQARHPSMDESQLFMDFLLFIELPVTAPVVQGIDNLILAIFDYARKNDKVEVAADMMYWWSETHCDCTPDLSDSRGEVAEEYIVDFLYMARLFSLDKAYSVFCWTYLQQGLGLLGGRNSDSTRLASCVQLLGGGHRIKKWCAGGGLDGTFDGNATFWLGKAEEPEGLEKFNSFINALDTEADITRNEWVKAVLLVCALLRHSRMLNNGPRNLQATKDHLQFRKTDLSSEEVYRIVFQQTKPGWASGDEPAEQEVAAVDVREDGHII
ncbi:hypothetical protein NMY22_g11210 [Coprinellus aureogranulatus]|nr:hypothetical protein NMY22_g11210 [Coprinellus aureogranulatus]